MYESGRGGWFEDGCSHVGGLGWALGRRKIREARLAWRVDVGGGGCVGILKGVDEVFDGLPGGGSWALLWEGVAELVRRWDEDRERVSGWSAFVGVAVLLLPLVLFSGESCMDLALAASYAIGGG